MRAYTLAAAAPRHVPAITAIYRAQIEDGLGSHEDPLPDAAEMARRLAELQAQGLPAFVALDERRVARGFAWATPFRFRAHYRHTVEDSIHIHPPPAARASASPSCAASRNTAPTAATAR
jgi:phosphinothricin acetyltransferase